MNFYITGLAIFVLFFIIVSSLSQTTIKTQEQRSLNILVKDLNKEIKYIKDTSTNLCFVYFASGHRQGLTNITCTDNINWKEFSSETK